MKCSDARVLAVRYLEPKDSNDRAVPPPEMLDHIASCPQCLEDIAVLGAATTGQPSRLLEEIYRQHGCDLIEKLLPGWVQSDIEGSSPAERDPVAWSHLQACSRCRDAFSELRELELAARAGEFGPLPGSGQLEVSGIDLNQEPLRSAVANDVGEATLRALGEGSTLVNQRGDEKAWTVPLPLESAHGRGGKD